MSPPAFLQITPAQPAWGLPFFFFAENREKKERKKQEKGTPYMHMERLIVSVSAPPTPPTISHVAEQQQPLPKQKNQKEP
jgi:hypothetical protein